jgi:hypothetical protein
MQKQVSHYYKYNRPGTPGQYEALLRYVKLILRRSNQTDVRVFDFGDVFIVARAPVGSKIFEWHMSDRVHDTVHPPEYDILVTAFLIRAKEVYGDYVSIESDVFWEDWMDGRCLYQIIFQQIPESPFGWYEKSDLIRAYYF